MSAPTVLPPTTPGRSPFVASRPHPCASPWDCPGALAGQPAAYVSTGSGNPAIVCGPCLDRIDAGELTAPQPAPAEQTAPDNAWEMTAPDDLVPPPVEQIDSADLSAWDGPLCGCANRGTGFRRDPATGRWVHTDCGRPALRYADRREDDGPSATVRQPDPTEITESDADRAADAAHAEWVADAEQIIADGGLAGEVETTDHHECECSRVTKRAKFGRAPDGRPTHEHCGGLLREKHRALAEPEAVAPQPDTDGDSTEQEAQSDDDGADYPDGGAGTDPGADAGLEARSAHGAARAGEGGDGSGEGAGEGDHRGDQGRGVPAGVARDAGGADPQPAHDAAVEGGAARGVADRLEGAQGGRPGDVGPVREEDRELAPGPGEVATAAPTADALGGLAAFFAQPADEDQDDVPGRAAFSLAEFFAQPVEADEQRGHPDDHAAGVAAVATAIGALVAPDSDNYLGEFSVPELLTEIGRRTDGQVYALLVAVKGEAHPRVYEVPR